MNAFDTRLKNNLFPEMPASFSNGIRKAMNQAGVEPVTSPLFVVAILI